MADPFDAWISHPAIGVDLNSFSATSDGVADDSDVGSTTAAASAPNSPRMQKQVEVEFKSQKGATDCKATCADMAKSVGVKVGPAAVGIEIAKSSKAGHIEIDPEKAAEGRNYIDDQLASGKPVVVGVSHSEQGADEKNFDKITDHYVLVTGRGVDENGNVFYTFKDPATDKEGGDDANPKNRFFVDKSGKMVKPGNEGPTDKDGKYVGVDKRNYEVSLVLGNAGLKGDHVGDPGQKEDGDVTAVREALKKAGKKPADSGPWSVDDRKALIEYQRDKGLLDVDGKPIYSKQTWDPATHPNMSMVTPGWIKNGDPTDRSLLGGFTNTRAPDFATAAPAAPADTAKPDLADKESGLVKAVKGVADTIMGAAEGIVAEGKELLQKAEQRMNKAQPASPPTEPEETQPKSLALRNSVGVKPPAKNETTDVIALSEAFVALGLLSTTSSRADEAFIKAIKDFQSSMKTVRVDGVIDPGGRTEQAINRALEKSVGDVCK